MFFNLGFSIRQETLPAAQTRIATWLSIRRHFRIDGTSLLCLRFGTWPQSTSARLAQSVERKALNLVVVGSSPTVGVCC